MSGAGIMLRCEAALALRLGARPMPVSRDGMNFIWPANSIAVRSQIDGLVGPLFWPLIPEGKDEQ